MTRRLTLALVGTVAAALLLTGLVTLALTRVGAERHTEQDLRRQVADVEVVASELKPVATARLGRVLRLADLAVVRVGPAGRARDAMPDGVTVADLDLPAIRSGAVVSGNHGSLAYAAAGHQAGGFTVVVVATRKVDLFFGQAGRWFVVAAVVTLLLAAVVAVTLARRLTRPLRAAEAATRRIAAGDLTARVDEPAGDDELADLSRSVNAMAAALERSRGLERQFLLSVSHDLRTPLTSIRGWAEALADGTTADGGRAAGVIVAESRRLERLVADLLELAKLDARRFSLDPTPLDPGEVAAEAVAGFGPAAAERGVALELRRDAPATVVADRDRLGQVIANLVENALRHAETRVVVGVAGAAVAVDDDGPGMSADDLAHAFDRVWSPDRRPAGSGLGLTIVAELVAAMGGTVVAGPSTLGGTRVTVTLGRS